MQNLKRFYCIYLCTFSYFILHIIVRGKYVLQYINFMFTDLEGELELLYII